MLFLKRNNNIVGDEAAAHRLLTALGIPTTDPDTNQPLTLEQRAKLLDMEIVGSERASETYLSQGRVTVKVEGLIPPSGGLGGSW